jgi:DNA-binding CsgD family transcriptional regulator
VPLDLLLEGLAEACIEIAERCYELRAQVAVCSVHEPSSAKAGDASPVAQESFRIHGLTAREGTVVGMVLQGYPNKVISRRAGVSVKTVERHLTHVYQKLGVSSRSAMMAAALASHDGWLASSDAGEVFASGRAALPDTLETPFSMGAE